MPAPDGPAAFRIECGCGFAVEGDEDETVAAARNHGAAAHGIDLADGILRALARPLAPAGRRRRRPAPTDTDSDTTKGRGTT